MALLRIGTPSIEDHGATARWEIGVDAPGLPERLWFEVEAAHGHLLSERADAAAVGLLYPAMRHGLDLRVTGTVTDELAHRLGTTYQTILEATHGLARVAVEAAAQAPAAPRAPGVASGFSAGVDSFGVLAEHHYDEAMPAWGRLTHLIFNNVGGQLGELDQQDVWRARLRHLRPVAARLGLPLVAVDSNLDAFYPPFPECGENFLETHTIRNASVAHLLAGGIGRWFYASAGHGLACVNCARTHESSNSEPVALPLLSTAGLTLSPHGTELRRIEKYRVVAEIPDAWTSLDVCGFTIDGSNCSRCPKCVRAMFTFELLGVADRFESRFDVDTYSRHRADYLATVLSGVENARKVETLELLRQTGFRVPREVRREVAQRRLKSSPPGTLARRVGGRVRHELWRLRRSRS
jgi:hypothetical protein